MLRLSPETLEKHRVQDLASRAVDTIIQRAKGTLALLESCLIISLGLALLYHLIGFACIAAVASTCGTCNNALLLKCTLRFVF